MLVLNSAADPDPYVFGPPGSGSFYNQAKKVRKTLIPTVLGLFFDILSLKNDVNVPSKSTKQKKCFKKLVFVGFLMTTLAGSASGSGSISLRHGSADPDPDTHQMDPQHWFSSSYRIAKRKYGG